MIPLSQLVTSPELVKCLQAPVCRRTGNSPQDRKCKQRRQFGMEAFYGCGDTDAGQVFSDGAYEVV